MLKVGQRVKKVRGNINIGITGVVVGFVYYPKYSTSPEGRVNREASDMQVKTDVPAMNYEGAVFPPGNICYALASEWEPIVDDGAAPSRYSFEELIEKFDMQLITEQSREEVLV